MDEWGVPRFFNPLGVHMPLVPDPPDIGGLSPETPAQDHGLTRWHGRKDIGPWTGTTLWQGERLDLGWALACFWREGGEGGGDRAGPVEAG